MDEQQFNKMTVLERFNYTYDNGTFVEERMVDTKDGVRWRKLYTVDGMLVLMWIHAKRPEVTNVCALVPESAELEDLLTEISLIEIFS